MIEHKSEPTIYALPAEPKGPVWDKDGKRWDYGPVSGLWKNADGTGRGWARLLDSEGPLTSAPPWKPEVGGIVETEEQYEALPEGSVVAANDCLPKTMNGSGNVRGLAGTPCTILRVGWES